MCLQRRACLSFGLVAEFDAAHPHVAVAGLFVTLHADEGFAVALSRLGIVDGHLSEAGEHDEQADASQAEHARDGPQKDEEPDAQEDVLDAPAAQVFSFAFLEELGRQLLSGSQCLFGQTILGLAILVAEVEDDEDEHCGQAQCEDDGRQSDDGFRRVVAEVEAHPLQAAAVVAVAVGIVMAGLVGIGTFVGGDAEGVHCLAAVYQVVVQFDDALFAVHGVGHGSVFGLHAQAGGGHQAE